MKKKKDWNMKFLFSRRTAAQTTLEFALLIVVVIAALLAMQIYMKRAVSGRLRQVSDEIGPQYEPRKTTGTVYSSVQRDSFSEVIAQETTGFNATGADGKKYVIPGFDIYRTESSNETSGTWGDETVEQMP